MPENRVDSVELPIASSDGTVKRDGSVEFGEPLRGTIHPGQEFRVKMAGRDIAIITAVSGSPQDSGAPTDAECSDAATLYVQIVTELFDDGDVVLDHSRRAGIMRRVLTQFVEGRAPSAGQRRNDGGR